MHPIFSRDIAGSTKGIDPRVLIIVEQHHEMADGSGYPGQLAGDAIDFLSTIITVCEAYCTLISPLNAANAIAPHEAINAILDPRFNRFNPTILRAFISNISLYPSGTFIELNNSIRAVVLSSNTDKPMRPKVLVLFDDSNRPVKPFPVDLSEPKYRDWFIERVIPGNNITDTLGKILKI